MFLTVLVLAMAAASPPRADAPRVFAECENEVARAPHSNASYRCYYRIGSTYGLLDEAAARLDVLGTQRWRGGWPLLVRGHVAWRRERSPAEIAEFYRQAATVFEVDGEALGEVLARGNLAQLRRQLGDQVDAHRQIERVRSVAEGSHDAEVRARAAVIEATHLIAAGRDLGRAYLALLQAEADAFPDGDTGLQAAILASLSLLNLDRGRYEEVIALEERRLELLERIHDSAAIPSSRFNIVNAKAAQQEENPSPEGRATLIPEVEAVLDAAVQARDAGVIVRAHALLVELWGPEDPHRAADHARRCREAMPAVADPGPGIECLRVTAEAAAVTAPGQAQRYLAAAAQLAPVRSDDVHAAYVWQSRLRVAWETLTPAAAWEDSRQSLDAIERLSEMEGDPHARIEVAAKWMANYHFVVGRLLSAEPPALERAFGVMERMRARALLRSIEASGIRRADGAAALPALQDLQQRIVQLQRQLLVQEPGWAGRERLSARLAALEVEERELRARQQAPGGTAVAASSRATLGEIRRGLRPQDVMLAFSVGLDHDLTGRDAGGGWVMAITTEQAVARRIPDRVRLAVTVPILIGLLERRDGTETEAAAALYGELLGVLDEVRRTETARLIIVPDGILHQCPFEVLRPTRESLPLGARYQISTVPSATLWKRWRERAHHAVPAAALVVADPELSEALPPALRRGTVRGNLNLGPLPHARREGQDVRRAVGGSSRLLVGPAATESALKAAVLRGFGILHLACHGIADDSFPDRSAVVLDPGASTEDGLLQPREVARLDLQGRAVVLSACRTADGVSSAGEGVLSLARSFFEAGAHVVVASRWQLRDDEGERFFRLFYRHLSGGYTVGDALQRARLDAVAQGIPAATWAGIVLIGNADLALESRRSRLPPSSVLVAALGIAALVVLGWRALAARHRSA